MGVRVSSFCLEIIKLIQKICKKHGIVNHYRQFTSIGTERWRCGKCQLERQNISRVLRKQKLLDRRGGKCLLCGYNRCIAGLGFHHLDKTLKSFDISKYITSYDMKKLEKEVDKCVVLCHTCHSEVECGYTIIGN